MSMTVRKELRFSSELAKTVEDNAKTKGIPESEYIRQAVEHFNTCKKSEPEIPTLRMIITKYPSKCTNPHCNQLIPIGSIAYWSKNVIICMDCFIQALGDKALASKYLKMRELNKIVHALEKEANQYADFINDIKLQVRFGEIIKKLDQLLDLNDKFLHTLDDSTLKELNDFLKEVKKDIPELKIAVTTKMQPLKKSVRKMEY